jgi:sugar lactone lactonase YvrE
MRPARSILITAAALVIAVAAAAEPLRIATLAGSSAGGGYVDGTRTTARFSGPQSLAVANDGTVYVADTRNHVIRAIAPDGFVSTVAGIAGERGSNDGAGREARFNFPAGIAVDANGTIYVADTNNHTIRKIVAGVVTTLAGSAGISGTADGSGAAARFTSPAGIGVALDGTIYVADTYNHAIRKITPDGSVTTLAGVKRALGYNDGFATQASFRYPFGLAVAADGTIYVADTSNEVIRKVTPEGRVTTVAGAAQTTGTTDGTGNAARFDHPGASRSTPAATSTSPTPTTT